jgi:hypothetical protein
MAADGEKGKAIATAEREQRCGGNKRSPSPRRGKGRGEGDRAVALSEGSPCFRPAAEVPMKRHLLIGLTAMLSGCMPSGGTTSIPVAGRAGATAPANPGESTFLATVTRVEIGDVHHPYLRWVVVLKVDRLISGSPVGDGFWFAIHSPSQEGVKVGQRYQIVARKKGDGYDIVSRTRMN